VSPLTRAPDVTTMAWEGEPVTFPVTSIERPAILALRSPMDASSRRTCEETRFSDRGDERKRERYGIAIAADIDPEYVAKRWYVNDYDFGTKYLRRMVVRWVNTGRAGRGPARQIAGIQGPAPLFRVCEGCGVLDREAGTNRPEEHRAWCRYRKDPDEHVRSIALGRTLTTQGAVIRLPQSVTIGDQFAIPSLGAALLLGLREQIGGSPDHIDIAAISEPVAGRDGATSEALLLHDVVPGGTGYLAELADPERMWDLLHRAWYKVATAPASTSSGSPATRALFRSPRSSAIRLWAALAWHNRIADDARKREGLRDEGVIVLGVTAEDVAHAEGGTHHAPPWLNEGVIAALMSSTVTFRPQNVDAIRRGPFGFLLSWIQHPDVAGHRVLANRLPFLFAAANARHFLMDGTADLAREAALLLLDPDRVPPAGDAGSHAWWWGVGSAGLLTRTSGDDPDLAVIEAALVVDDRTEELAGQDQSAAGWREWLRISNALSLREQPTVITALTEVDRRAGDGERPRAVRDIGFDGVLDRAWGSVRDLATSGAEREFVERLARYAPRAAGESLPVPVVGHETADGMPIDFAWPEAKIAVFIDFGADDPRVLELAGWRVFGDDPDAVVAALREAA
jgi:hypothetical protein